MKDALHVVLTLFVGVVAACSGSSASPIGAPTDGGSSTSSSGGSSSTSSSGGSSSTSSSGSSGCPVYTSEAVVDVPVPASPNGGRCGGVYAIDMGTCDACMSKSCCAEESACGTNAACVADVDCTLDCNPSDAACATSCAAKSDAGASTFEAVRSCQATNCATECSTLAALSFDCSVVCAGHAPAETIETLCDVLDPTPGVTTTVVECTFDPPPCDPANTP